MQGELSYLERSIRSADGLAKKLADEKISPHLISDVMSVLAKVGVDPEISAKTVLPWVDAVLKQNGFDKLIFIWDEFSEYIDRNRSQLVSTFQECAEAEGGGKFYFIPVTHTSLSAYLSTSDEAYKKINNRYRSVEIELPDDIAFELAAHAMQVKKDKKSDWDKERDSLWDTVRPTVSSYMRAKNVTTDESLFKQILPIHPMSAFLLKNLARLVGSSQRSMFEFLKGSSGEGEFPQFIAEGGPYEFGRQFLTVDYLWDYFVNQSGLGIDKNVQIVRNIFEQRKIDLASYDEHRVLKAVLLYCLASTVAQSPHPLLQPLIENVKRCFECDPALTGNMANILVSLQSKHCFSTSGDRFVLFNTGIGGEDVEKWVNDNRRNFYTFLVGDNAAKDRLEQKVKGWTEAKLRYDVIALTPEKCNRGNIKNQDRYGANGQGSLALCVFVLAKNEAEQLEASVKIKALCHELKELRITYVTIPSATFNSTGTSNWDDYLVEKAKLEYSSDQTMKAAHGNVLKEMENKWFAVLCSPAQQLHVFRPNPIGESFTEITNWNGLKQTLTRALPEYFKCLMDSYSQYNNTAVGKPSALNAWAMLGLTSGEVAAGAYLGFWKGFSKNGFKNTEEWFDAPENQDNPFTQMRNFCKTRLNNTLANGCSVRRMYIELQRAPYGLLKIPYSAFVLGFVLKEWLSDGRLQWADGRMSFPLDAEALADIIAKVVEDDGANKIKDEKTICRLSPEEKTFIKQSEIIFSIKTSSGATIEQTCLDISTRITQIADNAPLWMIPEYVEAHNEPAAQTIREVISLLCPALSVSSKKNTSERTDNIKIIGELLGKTPGLDTVLAKFLTAESFSNAFTRYVDNAKPELGQIAKRNNDYARQYYKAVKSLCPKDTSWLWNTQDIHQVLDETYVRYQIIEQVQKLVGSDVFLTFEDAQKILNKKAVEEVKVSLEVVVAHYPGINDFAVAIRRYSNGSLWSSAEISQVLTILVSHFEELKSLFFNVSNVGMIDLLTKVFGERFSTLSSAERSDLYRGLHVGCAFENHAKYVEDTSRDIDDYLRSLVSRRLKAAWETKTGTKRPSEWAVKYQLPTALMCPGNDSFQRVCGVAETPDKFMPEQLHEALSVLQAIDTLEARSNDIDTLKNDFVSQIVPKRYKKLSIRPEELQEWLCQRLGGNGNQVQAWLTSSTLSETVDAFIHDRYGAQFMNVALKKVGSLSNADSKQLLEKIVKKIPDAGFLVLEE
jgi:hypothetical protein